MKRINLVPYILLVVAVMLLSSCAAPNHARYRGSENSVFTQIQPMQVNPNVLHGMSPQQRSEYLAYVKDYNSYVRDVAYTNGYTAYNEGQWTGTAGAPPMPPEMVGGKAPKQKKQKASAFEKEQQKFIQRTTSTFSKEVNKAWQRTLREVLN